jgi:hypothetical protein
MLDGLLELSFGLLETYTDSIAKAPSPNVDIPEGIIYQHDPCVLDLKMFHTRPTMHGIGLDIMLQLFEDHDFLRNEIMDKISSKIGSQMPYSAIYIVLLRHLTKGSTPLLFFVPFLKSCLDEIQFLPIHSAISVLLIILSASRKDFNLHQTLMMFIRKALSHKQENLREIAVIGLTRFLSSFNSEDYQSQFFHEIVTLIKRCLMLSARHKLVFYKELIEVVGKKPSLADFCFDFLVRHLSSYCDQAGLSFSSCQVADQVSEPIHWLLKCCTVSCIHSSSVHLSKEREEYFRLGDQICKNLLEQDLVYFGLTESSAIGVYGTPQRKSLIRFLLVALSYEAMIEFLYFKSKQSDCETKPSILLALVSKCGNLLESCKKMYAEEKSKKSPLLPQSICILSPAVITGIASLFHPRGSFFLQRLNIVASQTMSWNENVSLENLCILFRYLLTLLERTSLADFADKSKADKRGSNTSSVLLIVESMGSIVKILRNQFEELQWAPLLFERNDPCTQYFKLLAGLIDFDFVKESCCLVKLASSLIPSADQGTWNSEFSKFVRCETNAKDHVFSKEVLNQFILMCSDKHLEVLILIAKNVHAIWGHVGLANNSNINEIVPLDEADSIGILTDEKSIISAAIIVCNESQRFTKEIIWVLSELKSNLGKKGASKWEFICWFL